MTTVDQIIAYEQGELGAVDTVELFSELVKDGTAWVLQGSYGRAAQSLIDQGFLAEDGTVDRERLAEVLSS
jgi:hypothetical protein